MLFFALVLVYHERNKQNSNKECYRSFSSVLEKKKKIQNQSKWIVQFDVICNF